MRTLNSSKSLPEIPAQCLSHYYSLLSKSLLSIFNFKCTQSRTPFPIGPRPLQGAGSGGSLTIQSPPPPPLLQLRGLQLPLICIPHQHLYYHPLPVKPPHAISNIFPNPLSQTRILRCRRINMLSAWLVSLHRRFCDSVFVHRPAPTPDQAVKSICEIWRPQDIPSAFATPPSMTSNSGLSGKSTSHIKQLHQFSERNTQLPSPNTPTTNLSPPSLRSAPTNQAPVQSASDARSSQIHIKGFVHEVLRRSRTSGTVLQTALCYLEAIRSKVPELLSLERQGLGVKGEPTPASQIVPATEAEIEYEAAIASINFQTSSTLNDTMDTVRIADGFLSCSETLLQTDLISATSNDGQGTQKPKPPTPPVTPLPPLPSPLLCPRRAFLASLILASKFTQDKCYSNRAWAKLSGLPAREIGRCERALGEALEWRLWVGKTSVAPASSQQRPVIRSQSEGSIGLPPTQARKEQLTSTASSSSFSSGNRYLRRGLTLPSNTFVTQPPVYREANSMDSTQELTAVHATTQYTQTEVISGTSATLQVVWSSCIA